MNDPHVERLHYEVGSGEGVSYQDPEALLFTNQPGKFEARDGSLVVEPSDHFVPKPLQERWSIRF